MSGFDGLRGGVMVCGTTSDAGKSFVVAGLCRLLARNGVRVAPFKAQNMANNAAVTADGAEIGHAQWVQAFAAGVSPTVDMNPVLLKPTSERTSQVVVRGQVVGEMSARAYHEAKPSLRPVVLAALESLRAEFDVVVCEGAGSPAEINLLDHDLVNLGIADAAGLPALVVGDIDRGGVFASLYGTVELLPPALRARVAGFVVNRLRGDPSLLGDACAELERRCGVPTLGVVPNLPGVPIDAEDSLALDHADPSPVGTGDVLDVAAVRWPLVANAGDVDPLRMEPGVQVRWVRSVTELGRPDLVFLPGSKATRSDLAWFVSTGLAAAVERLDGVPVVAVCAGLQMCGDVIADPQGVEGPPGTDTALGWLPVTSSFAGPKVLDRPSGRVVDGPGAGERVAGYRIHHGRVRSTDPALRAWLLADDGAPLGWHSGRLYTTSLHALFEDDGFRAALLAHVAQVAGKRWSPTGVSFAAARLARLDAVADALEAHLDLAALTRIIRLGERSLEKSPL
ncbi:MAG TPA: cobyric acid synthase [Acidimicrobiales bacterium]|nr:cobyric acid synthase [Acidimicrobiales bacterium]